MSGMFVKLFSQILDSSIADDRRLRHFFTDLLLCANGDGFVIMTNAALARRIGATVEEVDWGLEELQKPDQQSKTPDFEGRRIVKLEGHGYGWRILNYEHYRALKDGEQFRAVTRERVKRFRDKKKEASETKGVKKRNVTVTGETESNDKEKERKKREEERDGEEKQQSAVPAVATDFQDACTVTLPGVGKDLQDAWCEWQRYRQSRHIAKGQDRLKWTKQAAELSANQIQRVSKTHGEITVAEQIKSAISGNWQGLNLNKLPEPKNNQQPLNQTYGW